MLIQDHYLGRRDFPPFAAGDANTVMDLDLTSSTGATPAGIATHGLSVVGTPTFDTLGMVPGLTNYLVSFDFKSADRAALAAQGTIMFEFERVGLTLDQSQSTVFTDSVGRGTIAIEQFALNMRDNAANLYAMKISHYPGTGETYSLRFEGESNNVAFGSSVQFLSRYIAGEQDATFAKVVITWNSTHVYLFVDGCLENIYTLSAPFGANLMQFFGIGNYANSGSVNGFGNYHIKRVIVSKIFSGPKLLPLRFACYGDSFTANVDGAPGVAGDPATHTVAQIDAVQTGTVLTNVSEFTAWGQAQWGLFLNSLAWAQLGVYVPYYKAGASGRGYEKVPIPQAYADAVNAYRPEIVICFGSINDINVAAPVTNYAANIKIHLDRLIDGNPSLRKILFFEMFPGFQAPGVAGGTAVSRTEYERMIALARAGGIGGYRSKVEYIPTYEAFGGANYPTRYTIGASEFNTKASGPPPFGPGTDIHPGPRGYEKIAEIVWPYFKSAILSRPGR